MEAKRPKVEPICNPTLFKMEKLEEASKLSSSLIVERPFSFFLCQGLQFFLEIWRIRILDLC